MNTVLETRLKLIELALLLVQILDQTTAPVLHLIQTTLESDPVRSLIALTVFDLVIGDWVLRVPDIMSDEFFNLNFPILFQIVVVDGFNFIHEALNILNQNVIPCDQNSLLLSWQT